MGGAPLDSDPRGARARVAWRRAVVLILPIAYVAGMAVKTAESSRAAWLAIAIGLVLAVHGALNRAGETILQARAQLWTSAALSFAVSSAALSERWPQIAFVREITLLGACVAAARAIAAIDGDSGLAAEATLARAARGVGPRALERLALGAVALACGSAAFVDGLAWTGLSRGDPHRIASIGATTATLGFAAALVALAASALVVAGVRRLELAAPPRALACAAAAGIGLLAAVALGITTSLPADGATSVGAALACPVVIRLARTRDAHALARRGRRALTLAVFGGPVAMLAAIAAEGRIAGVGLVVLVVALTTMAIGALASKLEEPLLPAKGRLLDAFEDAARAAHEREARTAIAAALSRIREAAGQGAASPELWLLHPTRMYTVDSAGYLQERAAELPTSLLDLARDEPGGSLRVDVLNALEVRRADLRPILHWLEHRGALFATLVAESDEPDGLVIVPAGTRSDPVTLEEIHAAKSFADAFIAVCQTRSARDRHLAREKVLSDTIEALEDELALAKHAATIEGSRNALAAARLARPATVGIYSAPSRMAYDALERRIQNDAPLVVVARAGIDLVPYVARAHLSGPRKAGPLVIVDATSSREHDIDRWRDERTSPIALADRGLLVLVDGAALPRDIQVLVARALSERRPPWERAMPLDIAIALSATALPTLLLEKGQLAPELHARFEDANPIEFPGLHERAEDLFSIVADRLAREGLRVRGRPLGIDAAAFARLVEYPFEGEDAELAGIVTRLVAQARGDVVRAADVDALGLAAPLLEGEGATLRSV